jgi:phasin family protein
LATKRDQESVVDMIARLGRDLKLPQPDVERIIDHHRRNLEAIEESSRKAGAGASAVMERQRELLTETLKEISEMAQDFRMPSGPRDIFERQMEFARRSFEMTVRNAGEMATLMARSGDEAVDVLRKRITEGMEEIREGFEKRK